MKRFKSYKRIVIKIGSSLLVDDSRQLRANWLNYLALDIAQLSQNTEIIVVSSGAVALGKPLLNEDSNQPNIKQAAAACGQPLLMHAWQAALQNANKTAAQILVTLNDTESRSAYLNARNTIRTLLNHHIIPIINENDSVTTHGILYGDNDRLAARIATMCDADCLILLSDIDGLYDSNPHMNSSVKHIDYVDDITPEIEAMAGDAGAIGSGGMRTKIAAAKIAIRAGCDTFIGNGKHNHPIQNWQRGTLFKAHEKTLNARRRWIGGSIEPSGTVHVDAGAAEALKSGKSLLHIGITQIQGQFAQGDTLAIADENGRIIAKGLSNLDAQTALLMAGKHSSYALEKLGYELAEELIHRDHLVLINPI